MEELEEFRKTWRLELSNKKAGDQSIPYAEDKSKSKSKHEACLEGIDTTPVVAQARPDWTPQPFVIAESLLLGDSISSPSDISVKRQDENFKRKHGGGISVNPSKKTRFLDILISDLDEINEIPFFDIQIPKEVAIKIFSSLDLVDLCRCAQVSKSWKILAEDELLWCHVCHRLGYELKVCVNERDNWKHFVQEQVKIGRRILENWKTRTGALYRLEYVQGGVLCAAHSSNTHVVAGYTNGYVKNWHLDGGGDCILKPSHTALVLDETQDYGMISNHVTHVAVNSEVTVAAFMKGFVDIWRNDMGTDPAHTMQCQHISDLQISEDLVAVVSGHVINVMQCRDSGYACHVLDAGSQIKSSKVMSTGQSSRQRHLTDSIVAMATESDVQLYVINGTISSSMDVTACGVYSTYGVPVLGPIDILENTLACPLGVDLHLFISPYRVKLYDIHQEKEVTTLSGHTARVYALQLASNNMVVTGSADRKVRLYDTRVPHPVGVFMGHTTQVTSVQTDSWKVVSGSYDGMVSVWDHRVPNVKLWEHHNRHPVGYCHFNKQLLVVANIPVNKHPDTVYDVDSMLHRRYRGSLHAYDFSIDQMSVTGLPSVCLSSYDEPEGYNYNIRLSMPYDRL